MSNRRNDYDNYNNNNDDRWRKKESTGSYHARYLPDSLHELSTTHPPHFTNAAAPPQNAGELMEVPMQTRGYDQRSSNNGKGGMVSKRRAKGDDDDDDMEGIRGGIARVEHAVHGFFQHNSRWILWAVLAAVLTFYHVVLVIGVIRDFDKACNLFVLTVVIWLLVFYFLVYRPSELASRVDKELSKCSSAFENGKLRMAVQVVATLVVLAGFVVFVFFETQGSRYRLTSLGGMAVLILIMFVFSTRPSKIRFRTAFVGLTLHFLFGILVLRWNYSSQKFADLSELVLTFFSYAKRGTDVVYGFASAPPNICGMTPILAFSTFQALIYFGAVIAVLYHYGVVQFVLKKMAWFMEITMGTTATESLNACACPFLGIGETPLLLRPYIEKMTASELHAMMSTGMSSVAGMLFTTYVSFGACPRYLLSVALMSAPGSLAVAKMLYPECEESKIRKAEDLDLVAGTETSPVESVCNGAIGAVELTFAIFANIVAVFGIAALLDAMVLYLGHIAGYEGWSLELFLGYCLYPLAYLIGATDSPAETLRVAQLLGMRPFVTEFVAYQQMGAMVKAGLLGPRSEMLATFALFGSSHLMVVALLIGILGSIAPERKSVIAKLAIRAMFTSSICLMYTAAVAGLLISSPVACHPSQNTGNCFDLPKAQKLVNAPAITMLGASNITASSGLAKALALLAGHRANGTHAEL